VSGAQSPELQLNIQLWRQKARDGTLTQEEMRQAIQALRKDRGAISQSTAGSRTTKARKVAGNKPDADDMLKELEGL